MFEASFSRLNIFTYTLCFVFDWSTLQKETGLYSVTTDSLWNMGILMKPVAQSPTNFYWKQIQEYVGLSRIIP